MTPTVEQAVHQFTRRSNGSAVYSNLCYTCLIRTALPFSLTPSFPPHPPRHPPRRPATGSACVAGAACVNINGISGQICMPACKGYGSTCPAPSAKEATTARPYCDACVSSSKASQSESPNSCILVCNATTTIPSDREVRARSPGTTSASNADRHVQYAQAECPVGGTCKPLSLDKDACDNDSKWPAGAHPCQVTKTCGVCTFP